MFNQASPQDEAMAFQHGLSVGEMRARDNFVTQYLIDYDAYKACLRCGYLEAFARERAVTYMADPYVAHRIRDRQDNVQEDEDVMKNRIKQALLREANNYGEGSSHSARVSALKQLSEIFGIEANGAGAGIAGNVMVVPAIANVEEWEKQASASQQELTKNA